MKFITTNSILEGTIPSNTMKRVQAWMELHRDELIHPSRGVDCAADENGRR